MPVRLPAIFVALFVLSTARTLVPAQSAPNSPASTTTDFVRRPLVLPTSDEIWGGLGVCYGPFRDGQSPNGKLPSADQIREDLHILARHWRLARLYGSLGVAETACKIIREDKLPLKVMVGAWIAQEKKPDAPEDAAPDAAIANENRAEVEMAVKLANTYPDVVLALNIGNEAMVEWSDHRVRPSVVIHYLRLARGQVKVPVTTCDTELFWNKKESIDVARECDFLGFHAYAMWNKQSLSDAMTWTRDRLSEVRAMHPGIPIVLCETGWATQKGTSGYQAVGIVATPSERDQELFFRTLRDWAIENKQPYFFFSAFDENWKGSSEPTEVEKHWGVYKADRTPKLVFSAAKDAPASPR